MMFMHYSRQQQHQVNSTANGTAITLIPDLSFLLKQTQKVPLRIFIICCHTNLFPDNKKYDSKINNLQIKPAVKILVSHQYDGPSVNIYHCSNFTDY